MALNGCKHFNQVAHRPVWVLAGDAVQHSFQGTLAVLHRVGVSSPGGGEGAEGGQMFGVFFPVAFGIQQNHQLLQNVQIIQHCLQRRRQDLGTYKLFCGGEKKD